MLTKPPKFPRFIGCCLLLIIAALQTAPSYAQSSTPVALEYFNASAETMSWGVPEIILYKSENVESQVLFQRFDLDKDYGYLDSIRIFIDSASVNSVLAIGVAYDTLFTVETEPMHWPKLFPMPQPLIAQKPVVYEDIKPNAWNVIHFPHVKVPKLFHVGVGIGTTDSYFKIRSDDNEPFELNTITDRSTWLGGNLNTQNFTIIRLMTTEIDNRARYSNLYITAYVDTNIFVGIAPSREVAESFGLSLSPNPATSHTTLAITGVRPHQPAVLSVFDVLGQQIIRTEMNLQNSDQFRLDLSGLLPGTYLVRVVSGMRQSIQKLIITR